MKTIIISTLILILLAITWYMIGGSQAENNKRQTDAQTSTIIVNDGKTITTTDQKTGVTSSVSTIPEKFRGGGISSDFGGTYNVYDQPYLFDYNFSSY